MAGAAHALLDALPMILLTGQKGLLSHRQAGFQMVDVAAPLTPPTKMARPAASPAALPALVREAFRGAGQERPGPAHLERPEDIAAQPATGLRRLQIPFFTTQMGKGAVSGSSALDMGIAALSERDCVHDAIERAAERRFPLTPQRIVHDVRAVMPEDGIVCLDDGMGLDLVVVIQDDAYGRIRWKQAVDGFADFGMTFGNPGFVAHAGAFGVRE